MKSTNSILIIIGTLILLGISLIWWQLRTESAVLVEQFNELPPLPQEFAPAEKVVPTTLGVPPENTLSIENILSQPSTLNFDQVLRNVYADTYVLLPCKSSGSVTNTLILTAAYTQDPTGNNMRAAEAAIREWEPDVLRDIGYLLYPNVSPEIFNESLTFSPVAGTDYRQAVIVSEYDTYAVAYGWLLNYVFYGSSPVCVEDAMEAVYAPFGH